MSAIVPPAVPTGVEPLAEKPQREIIPPKEVLAEAAGTSRERTAPDQTELEAITTLPTDQERMEVIPEAPVLKEIQLQPEATQVEERVMKAKEKKKKEAVKEVPVAKEVPEVSD